jgi:hypothetical protein
MRDPFRERETPFTPNSGDEDDRLETTPGDGDAPLDGPLPTHAQPDARPDDGPPESPVWPVPRHDPA